LTGELPPGSRIDIDAEAQRLSASRIPIREARGRLESEGLVEIQRHRAAFVKPLSAADLEDIYVLRIALEGTAGRLGAERLEEAELARMRELLGTMEEIVASGDRLAWLAADEAFHDTLYRAARHPRLLTIIRRLREEAGRYRLVGLAQPRELELGLQDHYVIVDACARHDGETVERLIQQALVRWRAMLHELLAKQIAG
jgi:DNA-binding GntR family transcriptional regulator